MTRRLKIRFSIRFLLLLTAVAALTVYWTMMPTLRAHRFINAVRAGDTAKASRMIGGARAGEFHHQMLKVFHTSEITPLTLGQLWAGTRRVNLWLKWGGGAGYVVTRTDITADAVYW